MSAVRVHTSGPRGTVGPHQRMSCCETAVKSLGVPALAFEAWKPRKRAAAMRQASRSTGMHPAFRDPEED